MKQGESPHWARFEPPLLLQGGDLTGFLSRACPNAVAAAVEFIDRGVVNSNYRVELRWPEGSTGPATVLLRLTRSDDGPLREAAIGERLAGVRPGLAPRMLATESGERPEPHRRSLFSWTEGTPLSEAGKGSVPHPDHRAARELGEALALLHGETLPSFGALDPTGCPAPGRTAARWVDDLSRRVAVRLENPAHGLSPGLLEQVRVGFARLLAPLWGKPWPTPALVHGDLSPGNIILAADRMSGSMGLAGLVDWEMARAADPASDFASLRLESPPMLQAWVRDVEQAYREATLRLRGEDALVEWSRRVALAVVPALLDARMVAVRQGTDASRARIDEALASALESGGVVS